MVLDLPEGCATRKRTSEDPEPCTSATKQHKLSPGDNVGSSSSSIGKGSSGSGSLSQFSAKVKSASPLSKVPSTLQSMAIAGPSTSTATTTTTTTIKPKGPPPGLAQWLQTFNGWSNSERITALDSLVTSKFCEVTQMRHLLGLIEPLMQRDFISLLPKELSLYVLSFLEPEHLLRAAQACRYWRILCEDNLLWREKCREEGLLEGTEAFSSVFRQRHATYSYPSVSDYKLAYLRYKTIEHNWRSRKLKDVLYLKGHEDHVITCLQFNPASNIIVSGSDDNTLKVWSSVTGRCLLTLIGHTGGVWSSQLSPDNVVISGSTDRSLRVWDAISGRCLHVLYGHTSTVRCMALHGRYVVSGSRDATLRAWNILTGACEHILVGHLAAVRCVQFNGTLCVSGAYDFLVKVWSVATETCLYTLDGHTNRVYSLQFDGVHIVSGSLDTSIRVWSAETGKLRHTLVGHQSLTSGMQLRGNILVSGNADSTVKVWDITTGQCLQTLSGLHKHQSAVTCLQFNSNFVITSSDDGTVKLWDLKTGEFIRNLVSLPSGGSGGVVWRIRASSTQLVCAVGSRNGTEETKLIVLDFETDEASCYYLLKHYNNGDQVVTNEPCLNCTCTNSMLMCYLRVCPFVKPLGEKCIIEKEDGECCPRITCPDDFAEPETTTTEEPTTTTTTTTTESTPVAAAVGDGCFLDGRFYEEGAQIPSEADKPCELCYCIQNRSTCVLQECQLKGVTGCEPIYTRNTCCPVKYNC
ncbi:PREDICTED: F-box/WD repeat-containing protein 7-like, partial [Rhagoletis zephyria]|uniref:F-box/WD repeat-containing protein 7-like n=1 Tax=Rhagoletis zephyria TaxID=28612 RepID=UPI0008115083